MASERHHTVDMGVERHPDRFVLRQREGDLGITEDQLRLSNFNVHGFYLGPKLLSLDAKETNFRAREEFTAGEMYASLSFLGVKEAQHAVDAPFAGAGNEKSASKRREAMRYLRTTASAVDSDTPFEIPEGFKLVRQDDGHEPVQAQLTDLKLNRTDLENVRKHMLEHLDQVKENFSRPLDSIASTTSRYPTASLHTHTSSSSSSSRAHAQLSATMPVARARVRRGSVTHMDSTNAAARPRSARQLKPTRRKRGHPKQSASSTPKRLVSARQGKRLQLARRPKTAAGRQKEAKIKSRKEYRERIETLDGCNVRCALLVHGLVWSVSRDGSFTVNDPYSAEVIDYITGV
jgi:hypothetical protein